MSKFKAEAPFPQAGEGAFFRFAVSDIIELEEKYGVGKYFEEIEVGLNNQSAKVIMDCVRHGLKHVEDGRIAPLQIDLDQIEFPLSDFFLPVMDALSLQSVGMTYQETMEEVLRLEKERDAALENMDKKEGKDVPDPFPKSEGSSGSSGTDGKQD